MDYIPTFLELMMCLLTYKVFFNKNIRRNFIGYLGIALTGTILFILGNTLYSLVILVIVILAETMLIASLERDHYSDIFQELILSTVFILVLETLIIVLAYMLLGDVNQPIPLYCLIVTPVTIAILFIIKNIMYKKKIDLEQVLTEHYLMGNVLCNIGLFIIVGKLFYDNDGDLNKVIIEFIIIVSTVLILNIYYYNKVYKICKEKKNLELKESYTPLINDLVDSFRANEHEYKNHLTTLYNMVQLSDDEILKEKFVEYIGETKKSDATKNLVYIENHIVKALLYSKIVECEQKNIKFIYDIKSNFSNLNLDCLEINILLSNLLNNAIEAISDIKEGIVYLKINEENNRIKIEIQNSVQGLNIQATQNFFEKGFSTKGKSRGYGLYNIKKIVKKYKGTIQLSLENNMLSIGVII